MVGSALMDKSFRAYGLCIFDDIFHIFRSLWDTTYELLARRFDYIHVLFRDISSIPDESTRLNATIHELSDKILYGR